MLGISNPVSGANFSAQGNTLASEEVVKAMAAAYQNGKGSMAAKLMDALDAGQAKGGDTRGMQSAGILVVRPLPPNSESTVERIVDIRVDDHENPFIELRRLLQMTTGVPNRLLTRSAELSKAGRHDEAIAEARRALEINPRSEAAMYQLAKGYAAFGDAQWTLEYLSRAIARQPKQWRLAAASDQAFEFLRANPQFQKLIAP